MEVVLLEMLFAGVDIVEFVMVLEMLFMHMELIMEKLKLIKLLMFQIGIIDQFLVIEDIGK